LEGRGLSGEPKIPWHGAEFHVPTLETYRAPARTTKQILTATPFP
jgi:hypothetical protein